MMGPNALWLTESLAERMSLTAGMRVLDMGCGKGLSSVFLAKEYGLQVWATDLWIDAGENYRRFCEAGVEDSVFPIHAEAHALPFADGFFDAMVSVDAYHYFGTDDLYMASHMGEAGQARRADGDRGAGTGRRAGIYRAAGAPVGMLGPGALQPPQPGLVETSLGAKRAGGRRARRPAARRMAALGGLRT